MRKSLYVFTIAAAAVTGLNAQESSTSKNYVLSPQAVIPTLALPPVVATVNGAEISVNRYWNALYAASGNTVMNTLIEESLIEQELAKKFGVTKGAKKPSKKMAKIDAETETRIAAIKKQFPNEDAFYARLQSSGMGIETMRSQIRLQISKETLLEDKIKVTSSQARKFYDENKDKLPKGTEWNDETRKSVEGFLRQSKFNEEYPKYFQLLKAKADVTIFLNP